MYNKYAAWHRGKPTKQGIVMNEEGTLKIGYGNLTTAKAQAKRFSHRAIVAHFSEYTEI